MQWLSNTLGSLMSEYPDGRQLQRSGEISRENLLEFFRRGLLMFDDPDVKCRLKATHHSGKDVPGLISDLQEKIFEELGINGDFGINFLGQVRQVYGSDSEVMALFYNFVSREEMACDEAEMEDAEFKQKYAAALAFHEEVQKRSSELETMTPEQKKEFLEKVFKNTANLHSAAACQSAECQGCAAPSCQSAPPTNSAMSSEEQMAFFQRLSNQQS